MSKSLEGLMPEVVLMENQQNYEFKQIYDVAVADCLAALKGKVLVLEDVKVEEIALHLLKVVRFNDEVGRDVVMSFEQSMRFAQTILDMLKKKEEGKNENKNSNP